MAKAKTPWTTCSSTCSISARFRRRGSGRRPGRGYKTGLTKVQERIGTIKEPVRVFVYDSGTEKPFTSGRFGIPTAMIEAAGGINIMEDVEKSWTEVSWEPVIDRNPEVIVIVDYGDVTAEQKIAFVKENPAFKTSTPSRMIVSSCSLMSRRHLVHAMSPPSNA